MELLHRFLSNSLINNSNNDSLLPEEMVPTNGVLNTNPSTACSDLESWCK